MYRTFLVFIHTYWGNITRRSYLFFTFGLPLLMVGGPLAVGGIAALVIQSALPPDDGRPVAIVDLTPNRAFADVAAFGRDPAPLILLADEAAATAALAAGDIQSYYIFPADYWQTGEVTADYKAPPNPNLSGRLEQWINQQVRRQVVDEVLLGRFDAGATIAHVNLAGEATFDANNFFEWGLLFTLIYIARIIGMFTSGYMYNSIAEESRNRTIEIVLTSVSAVQFVTGKLLGLIAVGLTQLAIWASVPLLLLALFSSVTRFNIFGFLLGWDQLPLVVSLLLGAYLLDQLVAAATGILRVSGGAGPQLFNAIGWTTTIALLYAGYFVPRNPNAPLAVITSLIPFTSPIVMLTRAVASKVPVWQVVLSQLLLWGTAVITLLALSALLRRNLVAHASRFQLLLWLKKRMNFG